MIVVPNIAFHGERVAAGDELPPVRVARQLVEHGAREIALLDLDGVVASDVLPEWLPSLVAISGVPVRFDGRVHDGTRIERLTRAGLTTVVVDQQAVFDPIVMRWALDLHGSVLCVELQADAEYVFDPPPSSFGDELVDVVEGLHMRGARRVLYRDVTGQALPLQRLMELGDRAPGMKFTYQGAAMRAVSDVAELSHVSRVLEAVLVDSREVLEGSFDLAAANRAAAPAAER
ncbi:MAG: 1-(5-phosphoribosyl)-5-((5-phosphoribosylamino)methylideneamino) imidazole-4-carboxamide isomerase [Thermoleophilia bacterium]|nr:1-(5-phosphoribosyl)-5-((5-phosphoribosylamino)methylideneamino) imidazole-4-carboxamide isomerase [Thermoleophilia bacterium]